MKGIDMKKNKHLLCTSLIALSAVMTGCATNRSEVEYGFLTRAQNMSGNPGAQVSVRQVRTPRGHDINGRITYVNENGALVSEQFRSDGRDYKHITTVTDNRGVVAQPSLAETPWQGNPSGNPIEMGGVQFSSGEWHSEKAIRETIQNNTKKNDNFIDKNRKNISHVNQMFNDALIRGM
jgi:hypothetical protein